MKYYNRELESHKNGNKALDEKSSQGTFERSKSLKIDSLISD
jgi:hypothetical protein